MERLRFNQLKAFVALDSHDFFPQIHFHTEDLRWLIQQAEKAEFLEKLLRSIAEEMNGKEFSEIIDIARKALKY